MCGSHTLLCPGAVLQGLRLRARLRGAQDPPRGDRLALRIRALALKCVMGSHSTLGSVCVPLRGDGVG